MSSKAYKKKTGNQAYHAAIDSRDIDRLYEATLKEASRQVGEMQKWMKIQSESDPLGMLFEFEDSLFPVIRKAIRYRTRIYNRNKDLPFMDVRIAMARQNKGSAETVARVQEEKLKLVDEQIALCFRIRRIYYAVTSRVFMELGPGEVDDVFEEFEYDPEKYG